jgi:hypothetical protein
MNPTKSDQLPQMPLGQLTRASLIIRFTVVAIVIAGLAVLFAYAGDWLTPHALTPASMINTFQKVNGLHQSRDSIDSTATATSTLASTCCPNTASEHRMFFKLMLDSLKIWAKHYLADGFRFDLMGFSFKNNMLEIKEALREIDPAIYLYGEGCDFGEVANNASKS